MAAGVLAEKLDDMLVLSLLGTDYRLHLAIDAATAAELGKVGDRLEGFIHARAKRIDVVRTGGRYIEPLYGRPRRVQGRITTVDSAANTLTVLAACPLVVTTTVDPQAGRFVQGQLVSFDIERGARFELFAEHHSGDAGIDPIKQGNPTPRGQSAVVGAVAGAGHVADGGALGDDRKITGRQPPSGETPISG
ncbi:MAG: hypothetical protein WD042_02055 [Phycisphaeraceae bacterium]